MTEREARDIAAKEDGARKHYEAEVACADVLVARIRTLSAMSAEDRRDAGFYVNGAILRAAKALVALDGK